MKNEQNVKTEPHLEDNEFEINSWRVNNLCNRYNLSLAQYLMIRIEILEMEGYEPLEF